ncbi:GNAT family N-acetyltransferase [Melaminivora sp.]|uniref:GNAT family N-acetyltransferase n=1 Tax=Melaminivora sp. TaxID=1933032 RepID=UPI0028B1ACA8|nr:GNAT family N-acetyltransferase [Melaminivora sp.]
MTQAGPAHGPALHWRALQLQDLQAMHDLHLLGIAGLPAQIVKPESLQFLQELLQGRGHVLGAWEEGTLVAYGVLQHDLLPEDRPHALLGLAPQAPLRKLAGAVVHPRWRGRGLQRQLILQRLALAGPEAVFATAAPGNAASWHSLLACGLAVRALQYRYGGHARYLLAREPAGTACWAGDPGAAQELGSDALARQQTLLDQGWRGVAPGATAACLRLEPPAGWAAP